MSEGLNIMVVDDSEDLRELISMVLERHPEGWRVVATAAEGRAAVDQARTSQPDLVLLDIAMPVMDGLQALTLIREESPGSIVVMLSAFSASTGAPERAMALGAHGYVEKGGGAPALVADLRAVLAREFGIKGRD